MKRRGPSISPCSTAAFSPQSAPPVSRTVVNPRSSIARIATAARAVIRVSGTCSSCRMSTSLSVTWTWQSISPGISVRPPQSITEASGALMGFAETSRMLSPSTRISWPPTISSFSGSSIRKFRNRIWANCSSARIESHDGWDLKRTTRGKPMGDQVALTEAELNVLKRIERLPFSRFHWKLLLMGGLGYTFDAMDGAMIAFILPAVSSLWGLTNQQTGLLASSAMIGYLFGAFFAGTLGDLIGRRTVMMYALVLYSLATLIAAFSPNWQFLFGWRVAASFGVGAESAIIAPFLSEFVQKKYRGRFVGSLSGFFSFGFVLAALIGYFVVPASREGWRIVQVVSALPIAMLLWWRRSLPESPRWLMQRGRSAEAKAEVDRMEAEVIQSGHASLPPLESVEVPPIGVRQGGTFVKNLA